MAIRHGTFVWYELMTPDTQAAASFYSSVVGWNIADAGVPGMSYTFFKTGQNRVAGIMKLGDEMCSAGIPPNWTGYVAVADVDMSAADFVLNGGVVRRAPADIPGIGRFAVVSDPHGGVLCLFTGAAGDPPKTQPMGTPGYVGWHELYANNGAEAFDFYERVFGWTKDHVFDMGEMGPYQIFTTGGSPIGGIMTRPPQVPKAFWGYYFTVEAIDAAAERIQALSGTVIMGPMEVPGGAWVLQAVDPQGAHFALTAARR